ncbi:cation:proton antiporter [Modestobacter sp. VKM Ac-2979]|uniref:cation:proton antiporter domain-containing protein n=1 Tax=unclassified Modestobacter TaxID=2643866 RepID=UPI0022ABBA38|nr:MULTISPECIES: cation:proton antiporter [unclassified Modestobacter]MCZ2812769.1 cation:proton antiporter [Modestobacter sp. VKM Ac-2979]MCZ2843202.1 cation:proton antiporter [Modestobacter sp. VKM Ac-2980]
MEDLHLGYALVGSLAVALAALSSKMRDLPFSEPLLALLLGVVVGPQVLGLIEVADPLRTPLVHEMARVLLAISLIGVALRFPVRRLRPVVTPTTVLVTVGMLGMAALSAGLAWLVLGIPVALAALIGACITPTDPVLASSVVTGKPAEEHLPARTRQLLSEESGANDGLALPLVLLGIALVLADSLGHAALDGLYQVVVGIVIGIVVGLIAGRAMSFAMSRSDVDEGPSLVFTLVLAVAVLGIARIANSDGVLAVFVAGLAYNFAVAQDEVGPQNTIDEGVNRYLVLPLFLLLGILLPWSAWADLGWAAVVFPVAVLLLRRLPVLLALARPLGLRLRDAVFLGWFGPIGVSALFYLTLSEEDGVTDPRLWAAGTLVVAASTVAHGISSAPGRRLYRRAAGS